MDSIIIILIIVVFIMSMVIIRLNRDRKKLTAEHLAWEASILPSIDLAEKQNQADNWTNR